MFCDAYIFKSINQMRSFSNEVEMTTMVMTMMMTMMTMTLIVCKGGGGVDIPQKYTLDAIIFKRGGNGKWDDGE